VPLITLPGLRPRPDVRIAYVNLPDRSATDRYVTASGQALDYSFDVDLGELMPGYHVVARGVGQVPKVSIPDDAGLPQDIIDRVEEDNRTPRDQVHFEHVPGLTRESVIPGWSLTVSDDVGTEYSGVDAGAYDGLSGGATTHAVREIGGKVPIQATKLTLHFVPGHDMTGRAWHPPEPWIRELVIDLRSGKPVS